MALIDSDSDSSHYTTSSGDSEAMKDYLNSMSPKAAPISAERAPVPAPTSTATFDNLFSKAGLESDNDTSQPSGASTSVSSEGNLAPQRPPTRRPPSPKPQSAPKAPPISAFKSHVGDRISDSSSGTSQFSVDVKQKHEAVAAGVSGFLESHNSPVKIAPEAGINGSSGSGSSKDPNEIHQMRQAPSMSPPPLSPYDVSISAGNRQSPQENNMSGRSSKDGSFSLGSLSKRSRGSRSSHSGSSSSHSESSSSHSESSSSHSESRASSKSGSTGSYASARSRSDQVSPHSPANSKSSLYENARSGHSAARSEEELVPPVGATMISEEPGALVQFSDPELAEHSVSDHQSNPSKRPLKERAYEKQVVESDQVAVSNGSPSPKNNDPSILQRLEERRRSLQIEKSTSNISSGTKEAEGSHDILPTLAKSSGTATGEPQEVIPKVASSPSVAVEAIPTSSAPPKAEATVGIEDETSSKPSVVLVPNFEELMKYDESSSKLDSQSADYDPRKSDAEKWKALLVRRSGAGSSSELKVPPNLEEEDLANQADDRSRKKESLQKLSNSRRESLVEGPGPENNAAARIDEEKNIDRKDHAHDSLASEKHFDEPQQGRPESKQEPALHGTSWDVCRKPALSDIDDNDFQDAKDGKGWMPPALTTYGDQKYSPDKKDEKLDPPSKTVPVDSLRIRGRPTPEVKVARQRELLAIQKPGAKVDDYKAFPPPVAEIVVSPPAEDESSLGSMGFLFPKQTVNPKQGFPNQNQYDSKPAMAREQVMSHKLKPTVAGVDYDYYKAWILPKSKQKQPNQTQLPDTDREDPPAITTIVIDPTRFIVSHASPSKIGEEPPTAVAVSRRPRIVPSTSWAPTGSGKTRKHVYKTTQTKTADEWETWKIARKEDKEKNASPTPPQSMSGDSSSSSDWAPPGNGSTRHSTIADKEATESGPSWNSWIPPSRSARLDFTGKVNSQPTSTTKARNAYKGPVNLDETPSEGSSSSYTGQDLSSTTRSGSSSGSATDPDVMRRTGTDTPPSLPSISERLSDSSGASSANSRHTGTDGSNSKSKSSASSEDTEALFEVATQRQQDQVNISVDQHLKSGINGDADVEKDVPVQQSGEFQAETNKWSTRRRCLWILLPLLVVAGIIAAVVVLLINRGDESTNTFSPTQTPPPASPAGPSSSDLSALIISASPETDLALRNQDSPSSRALNWLERNQLLDSYSDSERLQRFTLAVLYYSTDGDSWTKDDVWLSDIDECNWYSSETQTDVCNSKAEFDELDLKNNELRGRLPWTQLLILASQLLIFDLAGNSLSGPLLANVGRFDSLLVFDVRGNELSGTIPAAFEELKEARQLDLSQNNIVGRIPPELSGMTSLQSLWLNDNALTGTIPSELGNLSGLQNMYLSGNDFIGTMPQEVCNLRLQNLETNCEVDCSCCTACGSGSSGGGSGGGNDDLEGDPLYELIVARLPATASALSSVSSPQRSAFTWLKSSDNNQVISDQQLLQRYSLASLFYATEGPRWTRSDSWLSSTSECTWYTSASIGITCDSSGNLVELSLQDNNLQGSLPMELLLFSESLEVLDLRGNELSGSISSTIGGLKRLEQINLSGNSLFGVIPSEMGTMNALKRVVLFDNNLFSTIPRELGFLTNMELLDLGSNQLTGSIPSALGGIQSLAGLSLYKNFLSGAIPTELSNLANLQLFYADENDLQGPIPDRMCLLDLEEFWSDCGETQCTCCTTCCNDGFGCV